MKLLVGLGNPGQQYRTTRHNAGFIVLDELVALHRAEWQGEKFQGHIGRGSILGEQCLLLKPMTFMNLSGRSVAQALSFYKVPVEEMVVIYDDVDVPAGTVKMRIGGSAGGHNGIKSILDSIGTDNFHRIKLGIGKSPIPQMDLADWVLGAMTQEELDTLTGAMLKDVTLRLENIFKASRST